MLQCKGYLPYKDDHFEENSISKATKFVKQKMTFYFRLKIGQFA